VIEPAAQQACDDDDSRAQALRLLERPGEIAVVLRDRIALHREAGRRNIDGIEIADEEKRAPARRAKCGEAAVHGDRQRVVIERFRGAIGAIEIARRRSFEGEDRRAQRAPAPIECGS
jgi:hypothetical protein